MNDTLKLIKVVLKMQFSTAGKSGKEKLGWIMLFIFLIPFSFILLSVANNIISTMYELLHPTGNENLIIGLTFASLTFILFFVSIGSILSSFYFSEDIESFIPFPFHPYQLMIAKAAQSFLHLYLTTGLLFLPILVIYGTVSNASFFYYLYGIILFFIIPIIPFVVAAILVMFLMRFANIAKNKDRTKIFAGLFSLIFVIGINVLVRLNTDSAQMAENMTNTLQQQDGLLQLLTKFLPNAYLSTQALSTATAFQGVLSLLGMVVLSVLAVVLFLTVGESLYFKGVLGLNEGNKSKKRLSNLQKNVKSRPFLITYTLKELRVLFRTPTFFIQSFVQSLFVPIFLIVILMLENSSPIGDMLASFDGKSVILLLFVFTVFILGVNPSSISSISKDGMNWYINLTYPVRMEQIIQSKVLASWLINLISIFLLFIAGLLFVKLPLTILILWTILALVISWFTSLLGTYLDFLNPKLKWTDEQEVFKSRMIGLKAIVFEVGTFVIIVFALWNIPSIQGISMTFSLLLLFIIIAIGLVRHLFAKKITKNHYYYN